jgi:hypothetical protein
MIFRKVFRESMCCLALLILPLITIRIIVQSTNIMADMMVGTEPVVRTTNSNSSGTGRPNEASGLSTVGANYSMQGSSSIQRTGSPQASDVDPPLVAAETESEALSGASPGFSTIVSKDDLNSFAGCMLIMDDNHFLIEWLAYHYHVMVSISVIVGLLRCSTSVQASVTTAALEEGATSTLLWRQPKLMFNELVELVIPLLHSAFTRSNGMY